MESNYSSKSINHLGLVSGICRELKIVETIDSLLPAESTDKIVSSGQAVLAMILNGLGFVNQAMYLSPKFFADKPVDCLIGKGLKAEHFNDDCLGRCLDSIHEYGSSKLYSLIVSKAVNLLDIDCKVGHMDMTSLSVYGAYEHQSNQAIQVVQGYSKDHRPDLNQVSLLLITSYQSRIPILMKALDGNQEEGQAYKDIVKTHISELNQQTGFEFLVFDSKGYNQKNLTELLSNKLLKWLGRVPNTISEVQYLYSQIKLSEMTALDDNYSCYPLCSIYGGVKQRWLVIHSAQLAKSKQATILKQVDKEFAQQNKALKKLMKKRFACEADAQAALQDFKATLKLIEVEDQPEILKKRKYLKPGKPTAQTPFKMEYSIQAQLQVNEKRKQQRLQKAGFFVMASNELDQEKLTNKQFLEIYKGQDGCEKGFRFLKNPEVVSTSLSLKKNERIEALLMVMTLCLFVYACLEHKIRKLLKNRPGKAFFRDQKGKLTKKPTARWVFHCFLGIHLLTVNKEQQIVLNLNQIHKKLLDLLGKSYWIYYS